MRETCKGSVLASYLSSNLKAQIITNGYGLSDYDMSCKIWSYSSSLSADVSFYLPDVPWTTVYHCFYICKLRIRHCDCADSTLKCYSSSSLYACINTIPYIILWRASEVGSTTNHPGSRQRQDTGPGVIWSIHRWKLSLRRMRSNQAFVPNSLAHIKYPSITILVIATYKKN